MRRAGSGALAAMLCAGAVLGGAVANPAGATPPLPSTAQEYWFGNYQIGKIWALGATGRGVTVAVLDSGVKATIPELRGVVLRGTDLLGGDGWTDTATPDGHGTSMARYIAGQGGGKENLVGIAPDAKILPVTINNGFSTALDPVQSGSRGIEYAVAHGAKVINISQAADGSGEPGHCPPAVAGAVRDAIAKGAVVVAGAGNDGEAGNPPKYPAACPGVLAVGAVDGSKRPWPRSERQSYVDVAAPGVDMTDVNLRDEVGVGNGTSNSTALVSGAIALVWSKFPKLTNRQVVARLLATVTDDSARPGRDNVTGYGIVRPYNAIVTRVPADAPNPVFDELRTAPSGGSSTPAASSPGRPAGGPASSAAGGPSSSSHSSGTSAALVALVVIAALLVLGLLLALILRRRRPTPAASPPPGVPPAAYPPPQRPAPPTGQPGPPPPYQPPPQS